MRIVFQALLIQVQPLAVRVSLLFTLSTLFYFYLFRDPPFNLDVAFIFFVSHLFDIFIHLTIHFKHFDT